MRQLLNDIGGTDIAAFAVTGVLVLVITLVYLWWNEQSSGKLSVPGLKPTDKELGNLGALTRDGGLHEFLLKNHKKFGGIFSFYWGKELAVSLADPNLWKEVQTLFNRPVNQFALFKPLIGESSLQYINLPLGRKYRQLHDRHYSHSAIGSYFGEFLKVSEELVEKWKTASPEEHIPLRQHMLAIAMKSIVRTSFGENLLKSNKEILELQKAYDTCWNDMEIRLNGDFPEPGSERMKKFDNALAYLRKKTQEMIEIQRSATRNSPPNFLDVLLEDETIYQNEDQVRDMVITYFIGGFHTTGNLLTWTLYYLCKHSDVMKKVNEEIDRVLKPGDVLNMKQCDDLKYLQQVVNEALRCSVLAPYAARYSDYDIVIGGHVIPKQTPLILSLGTMLQNDKAFPEPQRFDPERFNEENTKKRHPMIFQPFGFAGKRKCPGYRFAYYEAYVFLVAILRNFKVKLVDGQNVEMAHHLVTQPKEEIWIQVEKRE